MEEKLVPDAPSGSSELSGEAAVSEIDEGTQAGTQAGKINSAGRDSSAREASMVLFAGPSAAKVPTAKLATDQSLRLPSHVSGRPSRIMQSLQLTRFPLTRKTNVGMRSMGSEMTVAAGFDRGILKAKQNDLTQLEDMEKDPKLAKLAHLISEFRVALRDQEQSMPASPDEISWNCVEALRNLTSKSDKGCTELLRKEDPSNQVAVAHHR